MTAAAEAPPTSAIDRLLCTIVEGRGGDAAALYSSDAVLDATVPTWRFQKHGASAIAAVWSSWFDQLCEFTELDRIPVPNGEVVRYLIAGEENGVPFAVHHCHIITLDHPSGLIVQHRVWCGGRWYADQLAEMEAAQRADDEVERERSIPAI
jgi:hypothetical protein